MAGSQTKTVRFSALLQASGQPEQVTLWTAPEDDRDFTRGVKENRVATIVQHNTGTAKDFGLVGFERLDNATFLLFPKPIPYSAGTKIIGIKYEKLAASKPKGEVYKPPSARKAKPSKGQPTRDRPKLSRKSTQRKIPRERPAPKLFQFRAWVEFTARQRVPVEVEAASAKEAVEKVRTRSVALKMDLAKAEISTRVTKPEKLA